MCNPWRMIVGKHMLSRAVIYSQQNLTLNTVKRRFDFLALSCMSVSPIQIDKRYYSTSYFSHYIAFLSTHESYITWNGLTQQKIKTKEERKNEQKGYKSYISVHQCPILFCILCMKILCMSTSIAFCLVCLSCYWWGSWIYFPFFFHISTHVAPLSPQICLLTVNACMLLCLLTWLLCIHIIWSSDADFTMNVRINVRTFAFMGHICGCHCIHHIPGEIYLR